MDSKNPSSCQHLESFSSAVKCCKSNCLRDVYGNYNITNDVWEKNQRQMLKDRERMSSSEKDFVLRQSIYAKLKEANITSTSTHNPLKFDMIFETSGESKTLTLCESCYVQFYDHKGNHVDVLSISQLITITYA